MNPERKTPLYTSEHSSIDENQPLGNWEGRLNAQASRRNDVSQKTYKKLSGTTVLSQEFVCGKAFALPQFFIQYSLQPVCGTAPDAFVFLFFEAICRADAFSLHDILFVMMKNTG